ncbi:MAG: chromate efflux transporter [Pseudomonadota bacterium]
MRDPRTPASTDRTAHVAEIFAAFLKLGLTSFGGPIAHLGYFRAEFVARRRWLSDGDYADLVALCQFLPGPASSQVGFAIGLMRGGWLGALAAFVAFTLPSALMLAGFALALPMWQGPLTLGVVQGLKIVAVAIVAQAVWGMAQSLCPDRTRAGIALGAVTWLAFVPGVWGMLGAIALGAIAGSALIRPEIAAPDGSSLTMPIRPRQARMAAVTLGLLLLGLPLLAHLAPVVAMLDAYFRAGALVFGGGHVVLPLLEAETVARGWLTPEAFLTGYGAAQAVPGPLFTFAAYLGAVQSAGPNGILGSGLALLAVFAPGFLVLIAVLPYWHRLRARTGAQAMMRGANAAVVGVLAAALYDPVFSSAITDSQGFALALACFLALTLWKTPPWTVVGLAGLAGAGLVLIG